MNKYMKIVLAKRVCLTVIGLMTIMTILSQPKPDITITQALKLDHFANPFEVLKNANVEKIYYQEGNDTLAFQCFFGRNVEWKYEFVNMKISAPDAAGVCYNEVGCGGWEILTDHKEWLAYYLKEAKKMRYYPVDMNGDFDTLKDIPILSEVSWQELVDPDTEKVIGRTTTLVNFDKKKPTGRVLIIKETDGELSLTLTWEFD